MGESLSTLDRKFPQSFLYGLQGEETYLQKMGGALISKPFKNWKKVTVAP